MSSAYDITPIVVGVFYRINRRCEDEKLLRPPVRPLDKSASKASPIFRRFMSLELRLLLESDCFEHVRIAKEDAAPVSFFSEV